MGTKYVVNFTLATLFVLGMVGLALIAEWKLIVIALAAVLAGAVNAVVGGGTLITFPVMLSLGVPALGAITTNNLALSPGALGAVYAQVEQLKGQKKRAWVLFAVAVIGGALGSILLLTTGERVLQGLIPWLILLASALLGLQDVVGKWTSRLVLCPA